MKIIKELLNYKKYKLNNLIYTFTLNNILI